MRIDCDQSFPVQTGLKKTAWDNGWRIVVDGGDGWLLRKSHDAPGCIGLAAAGPQGPWYLAVDHAGVAGEMGTPADIEGPG